MILATLISEVAGTDTRISGIIFLLLRRLAIFGTLSFFSILAKKNEKGKYHFKGISIQAVHSTGGGSKIVQIDTALLAAGSAYLSEINPVFPTNHAV